MAVPGTNWKNTGGGKGCACVRAVYVWREREKGGVGGTEMGTIKINTVFILCV